MQLKLVPSILVALAFCAPGSLASQNQALETSVTFLVPVNLTQLSPDLERVRASCGVTSAVLTPTNFPNSPPVLMGEAPVASGQVITTLRTEVLILTGWLQNAVGQSASYRCDLQGYSTSLQRWDNFSSTAVDAVFRLNPTPATLQGTFVW